MKVTITAIDFSVAVPIRGSSVLGYPGKFGCAAGTGKAVFIPARGFERNLQVGKTLTVEPHYEEICEIVILHSPERESLYELPLEGSFEVCGEVVSVVPTGNIKVRVRGLQLELERRHLNGVSPQVADWIRFRLNGLAFWDCNAQ